MMGDSKNVKKGTVPNFTYPMVFEANLHTVVWGGDRLCRWKGLPAQEHVGESWEVSAVETFHFARSLHPAKVVVDKLSTTKNRKTMWTGSQHCFCPDYKSQDSKSSSIQVDKMSTLFSKHFPKTMHHEDGNLVA